MINELGRNRRVEGDTRLRGKVHTVEDSPGDVPVSDDLRTAPDMAKILRGIWINPQNNNKEELVADRMTSPMNLVLIPIETSNVPSWWFKYQTGNRTEIFVLSVRANRNLVLPVLEPWRTDDKWFLLAIALPIQRWGDHEVLKAPIRTGIRRSPRSCLRKKIIVSMKLHISPLGSD